MARANPDTHHYTNSCPQVHSLLLFFAKGRTLFRSMQPCFNPMVALLRILPIMKCRYGTHHLQ
jgi:hypothetical protein